MFERFNEHARRALFFARYTATQLGADAIAPGHLAVGVLREMPDATWTAIGGTESRERVGELLTTATPVPRTVSVVEIPFTLESKAALTRGAEIADRHKQRVITPTHLLAGVMEDGRDPATAILRQAGVDPGKAGALKSDASDEGLPKIAAELKAGIFSGRHVVDERAIERLCADLFAATDRKDWDAARAVFADGPIRMDMTSLAGGAPVTITADELIAGFRQGLHRDKVSHHLVSNYRIVFTEAGADVFAHGYAWNRVAALAPNDLWETWGTYTFSARRTDAGWRLDSFGYASKLTRGNDAVRTHTP